MKIVKKICIVFVVCNLISCTVKRDNVTLSDFTKELISLYITDSNNLDANNRKDEIIVTSYADTLYYFLSIFSNDSKSHKYCREDFVGQTFYLGHLVRVFGSDDSIFYRVEDRINAQKSCEDDFSEYDPSVWRICLHEDMSFCKMKTYRVSANQNISEIQNLAEKYFKVPDFLHKAHDNEFFAWNLIENRAEFPFGEDSLRHFISSSFRIKKEVIHSRAPIIVEIFVDKMGRASVKGIAKSSNDFEIDNEALRVAEIICQYKFIPASHRGEKVNNIRDIVFF